MINWARVQDLKDDIGEEDFAEVVEMFLDEVEEVIERLKTAPTPQTYEQDLHFLKSSALNLGFAELSSLCQAGEATARNANPESIDLAPIFAALAASKAAFAAGQRMNSPISSSSVTSL